MCLRAERILMVCFLALCVHAWCDSIRFIKSESGTTGTIVDNRFQFDQVRNRFVYPGDQSLTVYFEWEAASGQHTLSAFWKDPEGRVATISPDVKMNTKTPELHAYWTYQLVEGMRSGVWTVEIRIDGQPAGSHSFELVATEIPKANPEPRTKTLNEIYESANRSVVWVYKLDERGRRADTSLGFVISPGQVATAFQSIDGAPRVEVEFAGGHKTTSDEVWACDRLQDWALLKVDTGSVPALPRMENGKVPVGERYLVFNVESGSLRVMGGVDIAGRQAVNPYGDRIQLAPPPASEAAGGPLLSPGGEVAGIVGGSTAPGSRVTRREISLSPALWRRLNADSAAVPIGLIPKISGGDPVAFRALRDKGLWTQPLAPTASLVYGGTTRTLSKNPNDLSIRDTNVFSHRDVVVWVYTNWLKKEKIGRGIVEARVYDSQNRVLVAVAPRKVSLNTISPIRVAFDFGTAKLPAGVFRVDVLWNSEPAWRTFVIISD